MNEVELQQNKDLSRMKELKEERDELKKELQAAHHCIGKLWEALERLRSSSSETEEENNQLTRARRRTLEQERDALKNELEETRQQHIQKQNLFLQKIQEKEQLQQSLRDTIAESEQATIAALNGYQELIHASDGIEQRIQQTVAERDTVKRELTRTKDRLQTAEEERDTLRNSLLETQKFAKYITKAHTEQGVTVRKLRQEIKRARCATTGSLTQAPSDQAQRKRGLNQTLHGAENERDYLAMELEEVQQRTEARQEPGLSNPTLKKQELKSSGEFSEALRLDLEKADKRTLEQKETSHKQIRKIHKLGAKLSNLQAERDNLATKLREAKEHSLKDRMDLQEQVQTNQNLQQRIQSLDGDLQENADHPTEDAARATRKQLKKIHKLREKLQWLQVEKDIVANELELAKEDSQKAKTDHQKQAQAIKNLQQQIQSLVKELREANQRITDNTDNRILMEANRQMRRNLHTAETELNRFKDLSAVLERAVQDGKRSMEILQQHIQELGYVQSSLKYELDESKQEARTMRQEVTNEYLKQQLQEAKFEREFLRNMLALVEKRVLEGNEATRKQHKANEYLLGHLLEVKLERNNLRFELAQKTKRRELGITTEGGQAKNLVEARERTKHEGESEQAGPHEQKSLGATSIDSVSNTRSEKRQFHDISNKPELLPNKKARSKRPKPSRWGPRKTWARDFCNQRTAVLSTPNTRPTGYTHSSQEPASLTCVRDQVRRGVPRAAWIGRHQPEYIMDSAIHRNNYGAKAQRGFTTTTDAAQMSWYAKVSPSPRRVSATHSEKGQDERLDR